jgi:hypothetical protein
VAAIRHTERMFEAAGFRTLDRHRLAGLAHSNAHPKPAELHSLGREKWGLRCQTSVNHSRGPRFHPC